MLSVQSPQRWIGTAVTSHRADSLPLGKTIRVIVVFIPSAVNSNCTFLPIFTIAIWSDVALNLIVIAGHCSASTGPCASVILPVSVSTASIVPVAEAVLALAASAFGEAVLSAIFACSAWRVPCSCR